jgi:hypothetical protein
MEDGRMVFGGRLAQELEESDSVRRFILKLNQAGRAIRVDDAIVNGEERVLSETFDLASNDPHVLALARVSGARVLLTEDKALHSDFTNHQIISKPRGRVYQTRDHEPLLHHDSSCKFAPRQKPKRRGAR